jgi:quinol monooxygenase YgiN
VFRRLWKVVDLKDHRHPYNIMPIHAAITRRVRAGCESEFQQALREFFQKSFAQDGVWGASMITPPPGSDSREFGILRTFEDEKERDAFYTSAMF